MKIAVLSGKGGTGKTLVSVNLAAITPHSTYMDCDVEEPNGYLFFKPQGILKEEIGVQIPEVDEKRCTGCRQCVNFCKFNALAYINNHLKIFDDVCHSCGGCIYLCPEQALSEKEKIIGEVRRGFSEDVNVLTGILNTGEASGIPIIKRLLELSKDTENLNTVFIDCPPGSACMVMESIREADYCVLVAEPTLFGVHNLSMVHELVQLFNKPHGIVLNKSMDGEDPAEKFALDHNIRIIGKIPFDQELGLLNSNALIVAKEREEYRKLFEGMLKKILEEVRIETTSGFKR